MNYDETTEELNMIAWTITFMLAATVGLIHHKLTKGDGLRRYETIAEFIRSER